MSPISLNLFYPWWFAWCFAYTCVPVSCVYFPLEKWEEKIPANFPVDKPFAKIVAVRGTEDDLSMVWNYYLETASIDSGVSVHPTTGLVHLTVAVDSHVIGQKINVVFSAKLKDGSIVAKTTAVLTFVKLDVSLCTTVPPETACFLPSECRLSIWENDPAQVIANPTNLAYQTLCPKNVTNYEIKDKNQISIDRINGDIYLKEPFDREKNSIVDFTISCNVTSPTRRKLGTFSQKCQVLVNDVNDNGPILKNGHQIDFNLKKEVPVGSTLPLDSHILVHDLDSTYSNYSVVTETTEEYKGMLEAELIPVKINVGGRGIYRRLEIKVKRPLSFEGESFNVTLVIKDVDLLPKYGNNSAFLTLVIHNSTTPSTKFSRYNVTMFSRYNVTLLTNDTVYKHLLGPFHKHSGIEGLDFLFSIANVSVLEAVSVLNVTPTQGIIYLQDPKKLKSLRVDNFSFNLLWKSAALPGLNNSTWINVTIKSSDEFTNKSCKWVTSCAVNEDQNSCVRTCGPGITASSCYWWQQHGRSSCVADARTCFDKQCDELESLDWHVCPQDCSKNVMPEFLKGESGVGIRRSNAMGVCSCEPTLKKCSCSLQDMIATSNSKITPSNNNNNNNNPKMATDPSTKILFGEESPEFRFVTTVDSIASAEYCDKSCLTLLLSGVSLTVVLITILLSWYLCVCKRRKMRAGRPKYLGSLTSLSAVPSDYVDERSSSVVSQAISMSDTLLTGAIKLHVPIDIRWEFPRNQLILEQTLGEGEFGKVMRAKAFGIAGKPGFSTVAVKMLKSNGTSSEFQDLLSEYNLLKDVSHPNVIKLLGACTIKGGPLYLIVEYAEYGSMRSYLRKSRQLEFDTYASEDSGVGSLLLATSSALGRVYQVNPRDLLSFMWQISKGMSYLSEMKVVHRDLATRNMLIAEGKVVKISDFGLSRDVYEGDTYFKKSKGRVPVKWMAIESLLNHVYTSKSDVWSFGVAMWEIVTLGSTPYPGVPPERLFHLLKTGYRMEKPDNCADELYSLMLQCWKENAHDRPSFRDLTNKFDRMLQDKVEYLDLGFNMVHNMTYFEDYQIDTELDDIETTDREDAAVTTGNQYGVLNLMSTPLGNTYTNQLVSDQTENTLLLPMASSSSYVNDREFKTNTSEAEV